MPTYDYECTSCGHSLEARQSFSEEPLKHCPKCGQDHLKRLIGGGGGIIFKGSGFYVNDSRQKAGSETTAGSQKQGGEQKSGETSGSGDSSASSSSGTSKNPDKPAKSDKASA